MKLTRALFVFVVSCTAVLSQSTTWWKSATIYQIAPRSFKDTSGDGNGDIKGITSKLDYFVETGIDVILISPFFETTLLDFAYDITNYLEVDSRFGTMKDVEELFSEAKKKGIRIILDFVPNHTSNKHTWFIKSEVKTRGFEDFYVWHDGIPQANGGRPLPPNSWESEYGGSVWKWSDLRGAYYFHQFGEFQPDLNLREGKVLQQLDEVLLFWLEKGADGFRIDAVSQLFEDPSFIEEPDVAKDLPLTYEAVERWRKVLDDFSKDESNILVPQVWNSSIEDLMRYYENDKGTPRAQVPMNFILINELKKDSKAGDYKHIIEKYMKALPKDATPNWFLGTHDHNRVASRMGKERIDGLMVLLLTLPGISFTYYGDEIGMEDHMDISWEDTKDVQACNANRDSYKPLSRDVARTPFQWDKTQNGGFTNGKPWIPVHPNFTENNLENQMAANRSYYKLFKELIKLRKNETFIDGDIELKKLGDNVLAYSRSYKGVSFIIAINVGNKEETVDVSIFNVNLREESKIHLAAVNSKYATDDIVSLKSLQLPPYDAVVIKYSSATKLSLSILAVLTIVVKILL